jgi:PKD repeat protein
MVNKVSSHTPGYKHGILSVFPHGKDSKLTLYEAKNNAETTLKQSLSLNSKYIILEDANNFPDTGLIKINLDNKESSEVVYYARKIGNQLHSLHRAFNGFKQSNWPAGSKVSCPVMADHHNALKDAIIKIQKTLGLAINPDSESINRHLKKLENKWLSPKIAFKAYPTSGSAPLTVRFQNFSGGYGTKFLWDFGDGQTSIEKNPTHIFENEGIYRIKLNLMSANNAHGLAEKPNYIEVNNSIFPSYFYGYPKEGQIGTEFTFVDQTQGDVLERHWFFTDGCDETVSNPDIHTINHIFNKTGFYMPQLMVRMKNGKIRTINILEGVNVL